MQRPDFPTPVRTPLAPAALALAAMLASAPLSAAEVASSGVFDCPAPGGGTQRIEFDERLPIAVVDDEERPASYHASHLLIRLDPEGRTLTIGRVTGRILASAPGSAPELLGQCTAPVRA